jgi:hypothetical protein
MHVCVFGILWLLRVGLLWLIRFSVKDTGIGISQPDLGKLFKSFSQVRIVLHCTNVCICYVSRHCGCMGAGFRFCYVTSGSLFSCISLQSVVIIIECGSGIAPGGPGESPTRLIRFSVKDTGIGISQPDLGKLFKSFSQVSFKLALVHSFIPWLCVFV